MTRKILLTLAVLVFALVVPILEVGETHVFNPLWPEHARLHEVWQLLTNSALGAVCLWLAWGQGRVRLASGLALLVTGGFLASFALASTYGGSMRHTDGSEIAVAGVNAGVLVMVAASMILAAIAWPRGKP